MLKHLRQRGLFQSSIAKQHRIAIIRALAPMENVNVLLDGTPKLTVQVSTKISNLRACVSTGNSQHHVWHRHILRLKVLLSSVNFRIIEQMAPAPVPVALLKGVQSFYLGIKNQK